VVSVGVLITSIYLAFNNAGRSTVAIGSAAMYSLILCFLGAICGLTALNERDIHKWVPIVAIVANFALIVIWVTIVYWGR